MYHGVIIYQTIIVFLCFLYLGLILSIRENQFVKVMLVIAFLTLLMNVGCLIELRCTSVEEGMIATKIKYMGAVYLATCFFTFCKRYCESKIRVWVHFALICWDTLVLGMMWTSGVHHLFFNNIYYDADAIIPNVVKEKGILFYIYMFTNVAQMLACVGLTLYHALKTKNPRKKRNYLRLLWCVIAPLFLYGLSLLPILKGFDFLPSSVTIAIFIMFYSMAIRKDFLISEIAHDIILQTMEDPIVVLDTTFEIVECNPAAERDLPLSDYKGPGKTAPEDVVRDIISEGSREFKVNERYYVVHGKEIYSEDVLLGYCLLLVDITKQKEQMMQMEALKNEADRANRVKSEFLAGMSHEIRTPLNAIIGLNGIVEKETTQQEIKDYASDIARSSKLLLSLVNDILDLAKIESNKLEIIPEDYVLRDVLDDLFHMHAINAKEKGLRLDFVIDPFLPAVLHGDDIRIQQVMSNLLSNAIKYTNHGSVTVKVSGKRLEEEKEVLLRVEIKDTGLGIRQEDLSGIVERFSRIYERSSRYEEGTGLGLSISIRLLRMMNSELEIESEYGTGSTFAFTIRQPIVDATDVFAFDSKKVVEVAREEDSFTIPTARILSVDDNEVNLKLFRLLMKPFGCKVECVTSGQEALECTRNTKYDIIFLDHMMPEMDGVETREKMLADKENLNLETPLIMLTANAISGAKEEYLEMGFHDYLMKPIDISALKSMLKKYLPEKVVKKD